MMIYMMKFIKRFVMVNCGDIVWAEYPFSDLKSSKIRPALVIANKNEYGDYIMLQISADTK